MNKTKYNQLKKAIIKAVPEIVALKMGCKVQNNWSKHKSYIFIRRKGRKSIFWSKQFKKEIEMFDKRSNEDREPFKIIGRPISLEDVLIVLNSKIQCLIDVNWAKNEIRIKIENSVCISWQLNKSLQWHAENKPETINFLHYLICNK